MSGPFNIPERFECAIAAFADPVMSVLDASGNRIAKSLSRVIDATTSLAVVVVDEAMPFVHRRQVKTAFEFGREVGREEAVGAPRKPVEPPRRLQPV